MPWIWLSAKGKLPFLSCRFGPRAARRRQRLGGSLRWRDVERARCRCAMPEAQATDARAMADPSALIERFGDPHKALHSAAPGATPVPV
jgi:hypothetical protein